MMKFQPIPLTLGIFEPFACES